jgi:hypothetical protein
MKRRSARPAVSNKIKRAPLHRLAAAPLARLRAFMDVYQFTAADEILAAFRMQSGLPVVRDPDLDIPLSPARPDAADDHAARRTDLTGVQRQWRDDLRDSVPLRVADAVLFRETPLSALDVANRWRKGTARAHLEIALKHFAALRGNCPRGTRREWTYNRAPAQQNSKGKDK